MRDSRRPRAAVRALAGEICAEIGAAPSRRCKPSRWPPSSTTEIVTGHLCSTACFSAADKIVCTSARLNTGLVFMGFPGNESINDNKIGRPAFVPDYRLARTAHGVKPDFSVKLLYANDMNR